MLSLDLNLHVQFYLVASSHYLYPEQCPVVNSDIKGSLKIDWKREIYLKKGCCDTDYSTTNDRVSEEIFQTAQKLSFFLAPTVLIIRSFWGQTSIKCFEMLAIEVI